MKWEILLMALVIFATVASTAGMIWQALSR
jgi:hypothetical protein